MIRATDQLGHEVFLAAGKAHRIVSLVPSQTELLHALGLENEVVGITKFCIHPGDWFNNKTRVGGTKDFKIDIIRSLAPDLILANKEENTSDLIHTLQKEFPVWTSDIHNLDDALKMIESVGVLTGKEITAANIVTGCRRNFESLKRASGNQRVLYMIWRNPWMCAGTDTFIHDMLRRSGFQNASDLPRYPEMSLSQIAELAPDCIFLSSEPYPFKAKHIEELASMLPKSRIVLVDGEYFSWYGSRLIDAPAYFATLTGSE
jgi:ABC-type Fe3+-hydroxamate transport system substrate-binding protein